MRKNATWDLGGITDPEGRLGRRIPSGWILVPASIKLDGETIRWEHSDHSRAVEPDRAMLNRFVQLWKQPAAAIVDFARTWGVLYLNDINFLSTAASSSSGAEEIVWWRFYSRRAMALLNVAASLKQNPPTLGMVDDWKRLGTPIRADATAYENRMGVKNPKLDSILESGALFDAQHFVAKEAQSWLDYWHFSLGVSGAGGRSDFLVELNNEGRWELKIDFHGALFPAIAFQLALVVVDADSLYLCSGCVAAYIRPRDKHKPKPGQGNYCPTCVKAAIPIRRANQRYRQKKDEAISLHKKGFSVRDIAKQLGVRRPETVSGWISRRRRTIVKTKARQ